MLFLVIVILGVPIIYIGTYDFDKQDETTFVPCYDRYNNQIQEVICIEEQESPYLIFLVWIFLPFIIIFFGLMRQMEEVLE